MFLDDSRSTEILFGSTRSIDATQSASRIYLWSVQLDSAHLPVSRSEQVFQLSVGGIKGNGYISGISPTLEGPSKTMHLLWNDSDGELHYMTFDWQEGIQSNSKLLFQNVLLPSRAIFLG